MVVFAHILTQFSTTVLDIFSSFQMNALGYKSFVKVTLGHIKTSSHTLNQL